MDITNKFVDIAINNKKYFELMHALLNNWLNIYQKETGVLIVEYEAGWTFKPTKRMKQQIIRAGIKVLGVKKIKVIFVGY